MNKGYKGIILASLAALSVAGAGTVWLLWQSWEEGLRLERQNRELRASLEASRIRLENFCEYPAEALCPADGSTAGRPVSSESLLEVMSPDLPSPPSAPATAAVPVPSAVQAGAQAEDGPVLSAAEPTPLAPAPRPVTPSTETAETVQPPSLAPLPEESALSVQGNGVPVSAVHMPRTHEEPTPMVSEGPEEAMPPATGLHPSTPPIPTPALRTDALPQEAEPSSAADATAPLPLASPGISLPAKKTWSNLDYKGRILVLNLSGEGDTLSATENALTPERYEVRLLGRYTVKKLFPEHGVVKSIHTETLDGDTVIVFDLKRTASSTAIRHIDERTVAIEIR